MSDSSERLFKAFADRYDIVRRIGGGGMASVYLAHDIRHDRQVAVKVLLRELAAGPGLNRFLREIKVAARLHHPHIVPVYDSGAADGCLYYVMPYEDGKSLREKLDKKGKLGVGEVVAVLRDVVDALAHAHEHGVVHGDIKPENVILSGRHALVSDFGVARASGEVTEWGRLTVGAVALGTPDYMAPEQASGDPHVDHRADIYAVGALAYELLTGLPPFFGTTPQEVMSAHVSDTPEPLTKHRASVPSSVERLVMKCLKKRPTDRWHSAEELLQQLEALATPSKSDTPTDTVPMGGTHVPRRTALVRAGQLLGAVVVAVAGWYAFWGRGGTDSHQSSRRVPIAVLAFENRSAGADGQDLIEGVAAAIGAQLAKIGTLEVKAPSSTRPFSPDEISNHDVADKLGVQYFVQGAWRLVADSVLITVWLVDAETHEQKWSHSYVRRWTASTMVAIGSDVAQHVAAAVNVTVSLRARFDSVS